eukprot:6453435-Lingulodinium_polyedra.AAC.1
MLALPASGLQQGHRGKEHGDGIQLEQWSFSTVSALALMTRWCMTLKGSSSGAADALLTGFLHSACPKNFKIGMHTALKGSSSGAANAWPL